VEAVAILRWVTTALLAVFVVYSVARGEVPFGGGRHAIKRQERPTAYWAVIGLGVILILATLTGFP